MEICNEIFLEDIVKVQIYRTQSCQSAIPQGVRTYAAEVSLGVPAIELALNPERQDGVAVGCLVQTPQVKVTNHPQRGGMIYQHELTATIERGVNSVSGAVGALVGRDVHIIYITAGGDMYLSQSLANTCLLIAEDNISSGRMLTIKASVKSFSPLIEAHRRPVQSNGKMEQ